MKPIESVLCQVADLVVDVPVAGGMDSRCRDYRTEKAAPADIVIRRDCYKPERWPKLDENGVAYMESAHQFYFSLPYFQGIYLHASAVELNGKAYLFSGQCGAGKSTHTRLWQKTFGGSARVFNDDKPALRYLEGKWYAYGTPWCGKDGININMKVPLAGICFLRKGKDNRIRQLSASEAIQYCLAQTLRKFNDGKKTILVMEHLDNLIRKIPIFELENRPEPEAARLSYETMRRAAEEAGL